MVGGNDPDRADAVGAERQEDPEIVLVLGPAGMGLAPAQPSFRAQMLEEGMEPAAPIMVAQVGRKRAGDVLVPAVGVGEPAVRADLAQLARTLSLIGDDGPSVGDVESPRSIFLERSL